MIYSRASAKHALLTSLILATSDMVRALPQKRDTLTSTTTILTPCSSEAVAQDLKGSFNLNLETLGHANSQPFVTVKETTALVPSSVRQAGLPGQKIADVVLEEAIDPFKPVATEAPPSQISTRDNHPLPRLNIGKQDTPLHTNKFYANLFLGSQRQSAWTHPYSVSWSGGNGSLSSWGLAITHIEDSQRAYGDPNKNISGAPASSIINPVGIQSLILSAKEFSNATALTTDSLDTFSVNANLLPDAKSTSSIKFPLVQGMGYVTGVYTKLQPAIRSGVFFDTVKPTGTVSNGIFKFQIKLKDGKNWLMYVLPKDGKQPSFTLSSQTLLEGPKDFSGTIQVAKNPGGADQEKVIDNSAGVWPLSAKVSGSVTGNEGSYTLKWTAGGDTSRKLLMYSLAHHKSSFNKATKDGLTDLVLLTTTKGNATAVVGNSWTMIEPDLPTNLDFSPTPLTGSEGTHANFPNAGASLVANAAKSDATQDIAAQTNLDSFYYAGKALSKFASIAWAAQNLGKDAATSSSVLKQLKAAFSVFTSNKNKHPLIYETSWKGVVSSAWSDSGADFGNSFYNDHHFHFGYFLHAAAMIGAMDPAWAQENKAYINTMVRDASNPSTDDKYFPVFRSFDWFHGHSWAKGLFESADGKDEESSSEDVMFAYGLKMWGKTVGDRSMEARGNLMLAVMKRSLNDYFLMASDNKVQPKQYIGNKVTGIMFDNKIDHTTYFGANPEYVQGIHMIPLTPASVYTRPKKFVQEEWDVYFSDKSAAPASQVQGGWKGILYANQALIDAKASLAFFNGDGFDEGALDGGASKTWYLAMAAGLGGV